MEMDERTMHNIDYMAKVNIWLVKTYREDLFKRFGVSADDFMSVSKMFDEIYKEQCKEMPLPWNEYGFCSEIVREDTSNKGKTKKVKKFDYNPIVKVPIKGI